MSILRGLKKELIAFRICIRQSGKLVPILFGCIGAGCVLLSMAFGTGSGFLLYFRRPGFVLPVPILFLLSVPVSFVSAFTLGLDIPGMNCQISVLRYKTWLLFALQSAFVVFSYPLFCAGLPFLCFLSVLFVLFIQILIIRFQRSIYSFHPIVLYAALGWCAYINLCLVGYMILNR